MAGRALLLAGAPGTGKTALALAISQVFRFLQLAFAVFPVSSEKCLFSGAWLQGAILPDDWF